MSTLQNLSVLKSTCQLHQKLNEMQLGLTAMLLQSQRKTFLKSLINLKIYSGLLKKKKKIVFFHSFIPTKLNCTYCQNLQNQ